MAIIFAANFAAANFHLFGFSNGAGTPGRGVYWNLNSRAGAGPAGQDAAEISMIGVTSPTEDYYGWSQIPIPAQTQGVTLYIRILMRIIPPVNWIESHVAMGTWSCKMCILGDNADSDSRVIWNMQAPNVDPTTCRFSIERNIVGFPTELSYEPLPINEWFWCQLKCKSGSGVDVADGRFSLYINEDNASELTPTVQNPQPIVLNTDGWNDIRLGYYGDTMRSPGNVVYQFAAFELGDTFDPTWGIDSASESPQTGKIASGAVFTMHQNVAYITPSQKSIIFTTSTGATIQQSNTAAFTNSVAVTLVNGAATLSGAFVRCTSGDITAIIKAG